LAASYEKRREIEQFGNLCANGFKILKQQFPSTGTAERNEVHRSRSRIMPASQSSSAWPTFRNGWRRDSSSRN